MESQARNALQRVAGELAEEKGVDRQQLAQAFQNLLSITRQARKEEYEDKLREAEELVFDPSGAPYVALALYLAEKHGRALILTYNLGDYNVGELEERGVRVLTPRGDHSQRGPQ